MSEEKIEKLFKWVDLIKLLLGAVVGGAVALAVWATKMQIQVSDNRADIDAAQANVQAHRDLQHGKDLVQEHRMTQAEDDIRWLDKLRHEKDCGR